MRRVLLSILAAALVCIGGPGCMTPDVWRGATKTTLSRPTVVGFVEADANGRGRGLVLEYGDRGPLGIHERVVVPLDADWRAADGISAPSLEGRTRREAGFDFHPDGPATAAASADMRARFDAIGPMSVDAWRRAWRPAFGRPPRFILAGPWRGEQFEHYRVGKLQRVVIGYWPPNRPALAVGGGDVPMPRWVAVPRRIDRSAVDRVGTAALAVAVTPLTLVADVIGVPTTLAVFLIADATDGR